LFVLFCGALIVAVVLLFCCYCWCRVI